MVAAGVVATQWGITLAAVAMGLFLFVFYTAYDLVTQRLGLFKDWER